MKDFTVMDQRELGLFLACCDFPHALLRNTLRSKGVSVPSRLHFAWRWQDAGFTKGDAPYEKIDVEAIEHFLPTLREHYGDGDLIQVEIYVGIADTTVRAKRRTVPYSQASNIWRIPKTEMENK